MKKLLSILVTVVMLCGLSMTICSCGTNSPELNLEKARKNLKDNGYYVELEESNFSDVDTPWGGYAIEKVLYAEEEEGDNWIQIIEFKTEKIAKMAMEADPISAGVYEKEIKLMEYILEKYGDEMKSDERDELRDEIKEYEELLEEEQVYRKGKYVWYGTKLAIEDTKG